MIGDPNDPIITEEPEPAEPTENPNVEVTQTPAEGPTGEPTSTPTEEPSSDPKKLIRDFVDRIYIYVLDREPEQEGAAYWTNELYEFKRTGAEVAEGFIFSEEFESRKLSDKEYLTILYKTFFGREPDDAGMNHWLSVLSSVSQTRREIAKSFIYSQEWADTCATYGIKSGGELKPAAKITPTELTYAFVERMYTTAMLREYDPEGREYWAMQLANFETTGEEVGASFFLSKEMEDYDLSDQEYVNRLYKTFMDREADADGIAYWLDYLKTHTRKEVVYGFTRSPEFTEKCVTARIAPY